MRTPLEDFLLQIAVDARESSPPGPRPPPVPPPIPTRLARGTEAPEIGTEAAGTVDDAPRLIDIRALDSVYQLQLETARSKRLRRRSKIATGVGVGAALLGAVAAAGLITAKLLEGASGGERRSPVATAAVAQSRSPAEAAPAEAAPADPEPMIAPDADEPVEGATEMLALFGPPGPTAPTDPLPRSRGALDRNGTLLRSATDPFDETSGGCFEPACVALEPAAVAAGAADQPTTSGEAAGAVMAPTAELHDRPYASDIANALVAVQDELDGCGDAFGTRGAVSLKLQFARSGAVEPLAVARGSAKFRACVAAAVRRTRTPPTRYGATETLTVHIR